MNVTGKLNHSAGILLAAGASSRMGYPKALIDWGGIPLLNWEINQMKNSGISNIVVVLGNKEDLIKESLGFAKKYCVVNPNWEKGRATSVITGIKKLICDDITSLESIIIQNVDQPTRPEIICRLLKELTKSDSKIVQPSYQGHGGHPLALSSDLIPSLLKLKDENQGIREIMCKFPSLQIPMNDEPIIRLDLNTTETIEPAKKCLIFFNNAKYLREKLSIFGYFTVCPMSIFPQCNGCRFPIRSQRRYFIIFGWLPFVPSFIKWWQFFFNTNHNFICFRFYKSCEVNRVNPSCHTFR